MVLLILFYVFTPLLILFLCRKFQFVNRLGSVLVAYIVGLIVANIGVLPQGSKEVQDLLTTLTIPLAIPLLLFSANIREWGKLARVTLKSMILGVLSVTIVVFAGFFIFSGMGIPELWKVAGMLIGVYTGGTPNLAALKLMLNVDPDTYLLTHTYDMVVSVVYLAVLLSIGKRVLRAFLPKFPHTQATIAGNYASTDSHKGMLSKEQLVPLLRAIGLAILIFGVGAGLSFMVDKSNQLLVVILAITSLGIGASLIPAINRTQKTFEAGMYLILIFSIVVASMADVSQFSGIALGLLGYVTLAVFGSLLLHILFAYLFRIDADTLMITSTALIFSPPFVPLVASALGNRAIIVSGLTVGLIGYAIGNYLGVAVAELLLLIGG